jgi:hypothetical protein
MLCVKILLTWLAECFTYFHSSISLPTLYVGFRTRRASPRFALETPHQVYTGKWLCVETFLAIWRKITCNKYNPFTEHIPIDFEADFQINGGHITQRTHTLSWNKNILQVDAVKTRFPVTFCDSEYMSQIFVLFFKTINARAISFSWLYPWLGDDSAAVSNLVRLNTRWFVPTCITSTRRAREFWINWTITS